jgi:hypothetical protein
MNICGDGSADELLLRRKFNRSADLRGACFSMNRAGIAPHDKGDRKIEPIIIPFWRCNRVLLCRIGTMQF